MNTRIFTLLFAFLAIAGNAVWGQTQVTISTAEEMRAFAERVNENTDNSVRWDVMLEADIDLGGEDTPWTPIRQFWGTFDGGNHTISGLYIEDVEDFVGLFGEVKSGSVKNLTLQGEIKNCTGRIGGFCGQSQGDLINCHNEVNITVEGFHQVYDGINSIEVGGVAGNSGTFENCSNSGNITINIPESDDTNLLSVGGIGGSGNAINCYNSGTITINGNNNSIESILIAGVIGSGKSIENCYNTGDVIVEKLSLEYNNLYSNYFIGGVVGNCQDGWQENANIHYCYNTGNLSIPDNLSSPSEYVPLMVGSILGGPAYGSSNPTISNCYYLKQDNIDAIGMETITGDVEAKDKDAFQDGTVAYELRKAGGNYGQDIHSNTPAKTPTLLCFTPDDAVYKLTLDYSEYDGNEQTEKLVNSKYLDLPSLENSEEGKDAGWYNENGNLYTSESAIDDDITLYAQIQTLRTITIEDTENGTITADKEKAIVGETITLTVTPDEDYQLASITVTTENGTTITVSPTGEKIYTFIMPDENVTVSAQFTKVEPPTDPDEGDEGDDIHHPQRPIKYYNIYVDTICPGLDVETSKDVVQEGYQVSAYLTIQAECDTTGMRFEYKRGLLGYWQDLKELEGVQPGEYIIKNIYTDIYIRALDATLPEEEPTGLDNLEGIQAYAKEGSIYVYTPNREEVTIVSMNGAILKHEEQIGWQSYAVNRGIYIVRVGEKVFKMKN